jgi:hypothetical protein
VGAGIGTPRSMTAEADEMHAVLVLRSEALESCQEGKLSSPITDAIEVYQVIRPPLGRTQDGKG